MVRCGAGLMALRRAGTGVWARDGVVERGLTDRAAQGGQNGVDHASLRYRQLMVAPGYAEIVNAPKALLHDHLDGGLRPATIVELAAAIGHRLPQTDPDELGAWFAAAADSGSL